MKQIANVRKTVCIMANELKKAGYSLSDAFKKAWKRVKLSMTIRATGTTFENRQERLGLAEAGMDVKALQTIMGHSDPAVTMKVYNHVDQERLKKEIKKMEYAI